MLGTKAKLDDMFNVPLQLSAFPDSVHNFFENIPYTFSIFPLTNKH